MNRTSELVEAFEAVVRDRGDAPLLIAPSERRTCSARQVAESAQALARALAAAGLTRGHLVIASTGNVVALPALVLACLRLGLPLMPVDRSTPAAELRALARRWDAAALVLPDGAALDRSAAVAGDEWPHAPALLAEALQAHVATSLPEPGRHAPAVLLKLTSGSTGAPRATCTEERHLLADVRHITAAMGIRPHDRQLGVIPLSHSYGFSNLLLPLVWQGTPLLLRPQFVPTQVGPDLVDAALTTFAGVPFMFEHLARHQRLPRLPGVRLVISAGARLPFETVAAFHDVTGLKVRSFYGSSETGGICVDMRDDLDPRVPVGRPMGETVVTLVPDDGAPEGSGRVQVEGPNVIDRYALPVDGDHDPADVRAHRGRATFVSGDYARLDEDGAYVLTGRVTSFVNVAGRKVHPHEVEAALRTLPGVTDAMAMAIDDPVRGQALGACLVSERAWDARSIREALSSQLAPYKLPRAVTVLRAWPLTDRGKVDRAALVASLIRRD